MLIIKAKHNMPREEMKNMYRNLLEQKDLGLIFVDDSYEFEVVEPSEELLDKIRADLHATAELHDDGDYYLREEWIDYIFDNYKAEPYKESEVELLEKEPTIEHCKNCKYFEYDNVAKVDGIPLIVAHEICNKWGDGCKTKEDGYCFLFEPKESEVM